MEGRPEIFFAPRLTMTNLLQAEDEECWYQIYGCGGEQTRLLGGVETGDAKGQQGAVVCLRWKLKGTFQVRCAMI